MEGHKEKLISVIIPTTDLTQALRLVDTLRVAMSELIEFIIVVNSEKCSDRVVERDPAGLIIIAIPRKIGFVPAIILGARHASGKYLLILNDDCEVPLENFKKILSYIASSNHDDVIFTCSKTQYKLCGQRIAIPFQFLNALCVESDYYDSNRIVKIPTEFIQGACFLISKSLFHMVKPTPSLFLYDDDVELSLNATRLGIRKYVLIPPLCYHVLDRDKLRERYCGLYPYYKIRNDLFLLLKFFRGFRLSYLSLLWLASTLFIIIFVWSYKGKCRKNLRLLLQIPRIFQVAKSIYFSVYKK